MKKFLILVLFMLFAVCAFLAANDFINQNLVFSCTNTSQYKMYRLFMETHKDEIAIVGSSRAEAGFAPCAISRNAFNYGMSGSGQYETLLHLKTICAKGNSPIVIINLDPWEIRGKSIFRGDCSLVRNSPYLQEYEDCIKTDLLNWLPGLRFYGKLRTNLSEYGNSKFGLTKKIDQGAILQRISRNEQEWKYIISKCGVQRMSISEETLERYKSFLSVPRTTKIVFVVSPISLPWWNQFEGKSELQALLERLRQFPDVNVIDMCSTNVDRYDRSYFFDLTHLNEKGALRFSKELKTELIRLGLLSETF